MPADWSNDYCKLHQQRVVPPSAPQTKQITQLPKTVAGILNILSVSKFTVLAIALLKNIAKLMLPFLYQIICSGSI